MSYRKCQNCHHRNRADAESCEACELPLSDADTVESGDPFESRGASPRGEDDDEEPRPGALPTDVPSPQFKGVGDVIRPTLEFYRKHFTVVGLLVVLTTLPVALLQFALTRAVTATVTETVVLSAELVTYSRLLAVAVGALSFAGTALLTGSLVFAVVETQRAGAASAGESLRRGLRVLPKVFVVTLLYTVVTLIGYVMLIVPGVIFSLMYAVAVPVAVAENRGPVEAMKRSARLTDGYRGLIFLTQFLWGLVIFVVTMIGSGSFIYGGAQGSLAPSVLQAVVVGLLDSSASVLTVYIFLGLLRERREGFATRAFTPEPAAR
jgi:hypothetical protein